MYFMIVQHVCVNTHTHIYIYIYTYIYIYIYIYIHTHMILSVKYVFHDSATRVEIFFQTSIKKCNQNEVKNKSYSYSGSMFLWKNQS